MSLPVPPNIWALSRDKKRQPLALVEERSLSDCIMDRFDGAFWRRCSAELGGDCAPQKSSTNKKVDSHNAASSTDLER